MEKRKELIEQLMKQYEDEFFKLHGFIMNSQQRKNLKKRVEKSVDRKLNSIKNKRII